MFRERIDWDDPYLDISKLSDEQQQELVDRAARDAMVADTRETCEDSLYEFVRSAWPSIEPTTFVDGWAIEAFCEHLEAVTLGQVRRLLVNYPPRCSKTTIASICWPAWTWARTQRSFWSGPQVRFLCASYNDKLSLLASNKSRRLILSPWYQKRWGNRFGLMWDMNTKTQFDNTEQGSRISTSVKGSLLGLGGDIIDIDDPHNTETEKVVESDADRKRVQSWWQEMSGTRLNDAKKSAIVVTMQRLHEEDLSGVILDDESGTEDWVHFMVPMEFDPDRRCSTIVLPRDQGDNEAEPWVDPREDEGDLMWPERFGPPEVERQKVKLGPYMASGRLQQSPVPKGGGIIQRAWWMPWDNVEAMRYGLEWSKNRKEFPLMELVVASIDTSFGMKEENDFNACTIWGIWSDRNQNPRSMLMYGWEKRLKLRGLTLTPWQHEGPLDFKARQEKEWGLVEWVADTCKRYKVQRILIENKARGYDVAAEINTQYARENWNVELVEPVGDKVARGHSVVPIFTNGGVWAPDTAWANNIIKQCGLVPKSAHDDLYDTVTQFLKWARERGIIVMTEEVDAAIRDRLTYKPQERTTIAQQYGV